MSTIITILGALITIIAFIFLFAFGYMGLQFMLFFHGRNCKHCNHNMDYKGFKEDNDSGHYLFHCPKCGAWEQVPKEGFFRQCDNLIDDE